MATEAHSTHSHVKNRMKYAATHAPPPQINTARAIRAPPPETNTARNPHFVATNFVVNKLHSKSSAHGALQRGRVTRLGFEIQVGGRSRYLFEPLGCNQNICIACHPILLAKMLSWIQLQRQRVRETITCLLRFVPYPLYLKFNKHASKLQPRPRASAATTHCLLGPRIRARSCSCTGGE